MEAVLRGACPEPRGYFQQAVAQTTVLRGACPEPRGRDQKAAPKPTRTLTRRKPSSSPPVTSVAPGTAGSESACWRPRGAGSRGSSWLRGGRGRLEIGNLPLFRIEAAKWGMRVCSEPDALDDNECVQLSLSVGPSVGRLSVVRPSVRPPVRPSVHALPFALDGGWRRVGARAGMRAFYCKTLHAMRQTMRHTQSTTAMRNTARSTRTFFHRGHCT